MSNKIAPVLQIPTDAKLKKQLEIKLEEYKSRVKGVGKDWEYTHPELAYKLYEDYRDACHKRDVLEALLKSEESVNTHELSLEALKKYGDDMDTEWFNNACRVIAHYLGDTSEPVFSAGTGLPPVSVEG